ncbi:hypothetical protein ZYGR_0Y00100 [Zygosaccharomyces rouxii]|uniref:Protein PBN1 n=2 Tax=Zygosaccharomyces rouxii TaxID=4956 RepID=C5DZ53_ZYGRC|nr:uncharacterized protein ZYRO0F18282g [Zygosaccharomyces rouxii]KAH9201225.1 protein PBN1 [Zygosaccharomyces rouxii]GAV50568.1 hypothetical protein ZYGR_0Y00100 [Zygosaccharomyces rouxii]CAQ43310.1 Protein PBN1 [Zygosaccharomyces rouxii]CAR29064.1 ZYRO0F18282p [Zygosaccharomyces rouxii]
MGDNTSSKRSRLSVVVDGLDYVESSSHDNGTHVVVEGNSHVVAIHRRFIIERNSNTDTKSRITWKCASLPWEKLQFWEPRIVDGFSLYSEDKAPENAIVTPKYSFYHSAQYEGPSDVDGVELDWQNCDIDVRYGIQETVVDQWCPLPEGERIVYGKDGDDTRRAEFGIFNLELDDGIDVGLEGIICRWNSTGIEKCQKSLTMFKKAHTLSMEKIDIRLIEPVGMHPNLEIDLQETVPYTDKCEIFMYVTLPKNLFVDRFGGHITDSVSPLFVSGLTDLEKPSYQLQNANDGWGSEALYRLRSGTLNRIEFHSRYSGPRGTAGEETPNAECVKFKPILFEACDTEISTLLQNPFYSKALGYEAYFTNDTMFHHFQSSEIEVKIPTAHWNDYEKTQWFTGLCLLGSIFYLFYKLFSGSKRSP